MSESLICLEARPWIFLIELVRYLIWGTGLLLGPVVQLFIFLHTHSLDDSGTPSGDKSSYTEPLPDVELIPVCLLKRDAIFNLDSLWHMFPDGV